MNLRTTFESACGGVNNMIVVTDDTGRRAVSFKSEKHAIRNYKKILQREQQKKVAQNEK